MAFRLDEPLGIDPCVDVVFLGLFGGDPGRTFQIEMQRRRHRGLDQRMLYG